MKMEYYLPTYDECLEIVNAYDGLQFYESVQEVDGYKISTFNYRLVGYNHFVYPLGENSPVKAFELRGICYVFHKDGSLYKRFLLMNKFFNINQVEETRYEHIKDIEIETVYEKCDGSVINFIELPNGKILAKSKMMVNNIQADAAYKIYNENLNIKELVKWALSNDIMPIFEYVSPLNRVVLKYRDSDLVLIRLRSLLTGEYLDFDSYPKIDDIKTAEKITKYSHIDQILKSYESLTDIEGCVVELKNNPHTQLVKFKTNWYFEMHGLMENMQRENDIIKMVLDETIDDYLSKIEVEDQEVFDMIDDVQNILSEFIHSEKEKIEALLERFDTEFNSSIKEFSLIYKKEKKDRYFHMVMGVIRGKDIFESIKVYLYKNTRYLESARAFLRDGDY